MQKEVYDKLNQNDRIEYMLEKYVVFDTSEITRFREFMILFGMITTVILLILKSYQGVVIVTIVAFIFYGLLWIGEIIADKLINKELDKKYLKRVKFNP